MEYVNLPLVFLIGCALIALLAKKNGHSGYLFFLAAMLPTVPLLLLLPHVVGASLATTPALRLPAVRPAAQARRLNVTLQRRGALSARRQPMDKATCWASFSLLQSS